MNEGWKGWDEYAPFYDWENTRTMGRRDVAFWQRTAERTGGPALELGCGTGRIAVPVARTGVRVVGVDRSAPMLERARRRRRRARLTNLSLVRSDIRALPFEAARFQLVMAPYGILQSLLSDDDLNATLQSVARVAAPGAAFGIDLVSDLPDWKEYTKRVRLRGRLGQRASLTLVESVRQDEARRLTIFDQEYVERQGGKSSVHRFSLSFRTLSIQEMASRLERADFRVDAVLGDYDGSPWDPRAEVWLILASRR
jgi:ubiquinone/menaquinone biosynthesis C-methylase UbiE